MTETLIADLKEIVGARHVITNPRSMERFCKGYPGREYRSDRRLDPEGRL